MSKFFRNGTLVSVLLADELYKAVGIEARKQAKTRARILREAVIVYLIARGHNLPDGLNPSGRGARSDLLRASPAELKKIQNELRKRLAQNANPAKRRMQRKLSEKKVETS